MIQIFGTALLAKSRKNAVLMQVCGHGKDENIPKIYQLMGKETKKNRKWGYDKEY